MMRYITLIVLLLAFACSAPEKDKSQVENGPTGEVWQVEEYVKSISQDPSLYVPQEWGNVQDMNGAGLNYSYQVRHKFMTDDKQYDLIFYLDSLGNVTEVGKYGK